MNTTTKLLEFITESPSCFHAVKGLADMLDEAGFARLQEADSWTLEWGKSYYVTRNLSSILAFSLPKEPISPRFMITSAHSDSPTFKLKDTPELDGGGMYIRINAEKYGGMIYDSWFDRPLSVAGRLIVRTEKGVEAKLVRVDRDMLLIPHIAPHMENCNGGKAWNLASDMVPLFGDASAKGSFMKQVAEAADVDIENVLAHDLYLYNRQSPSTWGANREFISAPKLDDLECAWAAIKALPEATPRAIAVAMVMDNEEVGSLSRQGASSTFLYDTLSRICEALGGDLRMAAAQSMMLSADNAHAVHPNNPSLADPTHRPKMNGGIVLKFSASQKYTTDGITAAIIREIFDKASVPLQIFMNRSDLAGGSTLGNLSNAQVSMMAADIGMAQLAMHSSYETAGAKDVKYLLDGVRAFYSTALGVTDGCVAILDGREKSSV